MFFGIFFIFIGGLISDKWGRKKVILLGGFLSVAVNSLFIISNTWILIALVMILFSLTQISTPAGKTIIVDSLQVGSRTKGIAGYQVIQALPMVSAPLIGGYFMKIYGLIEGFKISVLIVIFTSVISLLIQWLLLKETLVRIKAIQENPAGKKENLLSLPKNLKYVWLVLSLVMTANAVVGPYYIIYAIKFIGIDALQWGIIVALQIIVGSAAKIVGAAITDRTSKKTVMAVSLFLSAPLPLFFFFSNSFIGLLVVGISLVVVGSAYLPASEAFQVDLTKKTMRGKIFAFSEIVNNFSRGIGNIAGGILFTVSMVYPFLAFTVLELIGVLVLAALVKEPKAKEE